MGYQADHLHLAGLTDAVGTVGGLLLGSGVPPGIVVDDHVRAGEVEARAACLEGDQENLGSLGASIELLAHFHPAGRRGIAIQIHAAIAAVFQIPAENLEHAGEGAEKQHPPSLGDGFGENFQQHVQFAGGTGVIVQHQGRMAADLPQLGDRRQHLGASPVEALLLDNGVHPIPQAQHGSLVDLALLWAHLGSHDGFDLIRQLGQHVLLQAAHEEGADAAAQVIGIAAILIAAHERAVAEQISRQNKVEDAPQFAHAVLQGRTGQGEAR